MKKWSSKDRHGELGSVIKKGDRWYTIGSVQDAFDWLTVKQGSRFAPGLVEDWKYHVSNKAKTVTHTNCWPGPVDFTHEKAGAWPQYTNETTKCDVCGRQVKRGELSVQT